jgi:Na+/melibiose symporter-like transporter
MSVQASLRYTETVVREAALASWRRAFGIRFVVALLAVAAILIYLVVRGDRSWFVGLTGAVVVLGSVFAAFFYVASRRSPLRTLRRMRSPEASFQADAQSFSISSELGSFTLPWTAVQRLWRYPEFWIIVLSKTSQVTIPLAGLKQAEQLFVLERVKAGGGKIEGRPEKPEEPKR